MKTKKQFKVFQKELDNLLDKHGVFLAMCADNKRSDWDCVVDERLSVISWSTKKEFRLT